MSEQPVFESQPPPLPPDTKPPIAGKWILWIISAAVLPGLAFAALGKNNSGDGITTLFMFAGLGGQFVMSIILGITLSKRLKQGAGIAVLLVFALLAASFAVGCCSAFAGCAVAGAKTSFH